MAASFLKDLSDRLEKREEALLDEDWGTWGEIGLWSLVIVAHIAFIAFVAWRLAARHTEATGSSVLVPVKVPSKDDIDGSVTAVTQSLTSKARKRGGKELPLSVTDLK